MSETLPAAVPAAPTGETGTPSAPLSLRERKFVEEFLTTFSPTKAAIAAGYAATKAVNRMGYKVVNRPHVRAAIAEALERQTGASRIRICDELAKIAFADLADYCEWGPGVVVVKPSEDLTDEQRAAVSRIWRTSDGCIRIETFDKIKALELLGRATGLFKDIEISNNSITVQVVRFTEADCR